MVNRIILTSNGPLALEGDIELVDSNGRTVASGNHMLLCRCGMSENKPFCDGSHDRHDFQPPAEFVDEKSENIQPDHHAPLTITVRSNAMLIAKGPMIIESQSGQSRCGRHKAALCRCGRSSHAPFCDLTHRLTGFNTTF